MRISDFGFRISDLKSVRLRGGLRGDRRAHSPIRNPQSAIRNRSGISLLEVLISMFVLLFGLMGVAAIFPVGNHYAGRSEQYDRGAALADQAFAEIKARGMLRPNVWLYAQRPANIGERYSHARVIGDDLYFNFSPPSFPASPGDGGPGHAFVLDPMGVAAGWQAYFGRRSGGKYSDPVREMDLDVFPTGLFSTNQPTATNVETPYNSTNVQNPWRQPGGAGPPYLAGYRWPIRRLTLPTTDAMWPSMSPGVAEQLFRLRDDLAGALPDEDDRPGHLQWQSQIVGAPDDPNKFNPNNASTFTYGDDIPLSRESGGSYSWIVTIVPTAIVDPATIGGYVSGATALQPSHSGYSNQMYEVSVAVFYKRTLPPSPETERAIAAAVNAGGELVMYAQNSNSIQSVEALDAALRDVRPGHWIALCGVHPTNGQFLLKWFRLMSFDDETARGVDVDPTNPQAPRNVSARRAMLENFDWPELVDPANGLPIYPILNLRAIIMPGVIGVTTQTLTMEPAS